MCFLSPGLQWKNKIKDMRTIMEGKSFAWGWGLCFFVFCPPVEHKPNSPHYMTLRFPRCTAALTREIRLKVKGASGGPFV